MLRKKSAIILSVKDQSVTENYDHCQKHKIKTCKAKQFQKFLDIERYKKRRRKKESTNECS